MAGRRKTNQPTKYQQMSAGADIVIVGAGVDATRRLATSGFSTLMLEATTRVGGRAWTYDVAGMRLDLGCGWLHSADRNPWTRIAEAAGFAVDRRAPAWGRQYHDIGFSQTEQAAARRAYAAWEQRMAAAQPASDCAADALERGHEFGSHLHPPDIPQIRFRALSLFHAESRRPKSASGRRPSNS
ncbi:MAG TPA: FAD-dependent oxidoreductase [Roseiarcus sp.]